MKLTAKYLTALAFLVATLCGTTACNKPQGVDPLRRSVADRLNKEAFLNRYRDPWLCLDLSNQALQYISDSLPDYADGELRARNNIAFAYYQMSDYAQASAALDAVARQLSAAEQREAHNAEVEGVIHDLLQARLLQRDCRIADSYRLLLGIEQSHRLERNRGNLLHNFAQTEYYITTLVLNFHYRDGRQAEVQTLIDEVERVRPTLSVDYAQDLALNYALAYAHLTEGDYMSALDYCYNNLDLMQLPGAYCPYHYANTLQMMATALKGMPGNAPPDTVLALYDEARRLFFDYGDPYQMLGGTVSTARYALLIADTAGAHQVLKAWLDANHSSTEWKPFSAPKMEVAFFDALLRSRYATTPDQARRWYVHHAELQEYIQHNEHEDFALQQGLEAARRQSRRAAITATLFGIAFALLATLSILLSLSLKRQRRERIRLQAANRRDIERIANVETCLSVLRHDISPYLSYLQSATLQPSLRNEITSQLLRTFENIKSWTRLSVPNGLTFKAQDFALQEVFDQVSHQVISPHAEVVLRFNPTPLSLHGDMMLITILLRNLVNNALQHTTAGSVTVSAAASDSQWADITVADTGSGITPEQQQTLFRADRTLPTGSEHGFGLILCRYIIGKHDDLARRGCKIYVESTPNVGTTMHCRLPIA